MNTMLVAYYRVSTLKQKESGLGLEAQVSAVERYAAAIGASIVASYQEVESGKTSDRPELMKAIQRVRECSAVLVIAKLDRLTRNVGFLSKLLASDVQFIACDNPHANKLTLQILTVMAEYERDAISQRTKQAMAAAKARGIKLGSAREGHWDGKEDRRLAGAMAGSARSVVVRKQKTLERYTQTRQIAQKMRDNGMSWNAIAIALDNAGFKPARGGRWSRSSVKHMLMFKS